MNKEKVQICIFVTEVEKEHLKRIANSLKFSQSTVVRIAIEEFYRNYLVNFDT